MGKNVAVFVDVANIFYAAKAAGVDIDYVTLLKSASAGRDLVRAYAYTGLDPDNENQRNFHDFLRRSNYKVVSKDIRKYGDGKVKANLDIELVVDMMKTARNLDIAIIVSGDGDFAPAIRAVQEMGVRCEVISFRGNTSSDLIEVADQFTDIIQLARVEKGSRSGRRVADDDADLSMTEVPDKLTEGTGMSRGRGGRSRGRGRYGEAEPVPVSASRGRGGRGRSSSVGMPDRAPIAAGPEGGLLALPGERLSKAVGSLTEADLAAAEVFTLDGPDDSLAPDDETRSPSTDEGGDESGEGGRRRRRRGGRGRGRGRGRDEAAVGEDLAPVVDAEASPAVGPVASAGPDQGLEMDEEEDEEDIQPAAPRGPRPTPFGSFWDAQLGTPVAPTASSLTPLPDDEDFDEPEIPEYLIAEQRRGQTGGRSPQGGRGGPRGGRSAYQSAMERERYGRGGGGGINRYPDVSARTGQAPGPAPRAERPFRPERTDRPREDRPRVTAPRSSSEPWSDVPPELEAMLRAQVAQKPVVRRPIRAAADQGGDGAANARVDVETTQTGETGETPAAAPKRRSTRTPRATAKDLAAASDASAASNASDSAATVDEAPAGATAPVTPKRRSTRTAKAAPSIDASPVADVSAPAPKRRSVRAKAAATDAPAGDGPSEAGAPDATAPAAAPRRRAPRKTTPTEPA